MLWENCVSVLHMHFHSARFFRQLPSVLSKQLQSVTPLPNLPPSGRQYQWTLTPWKLSPPTPCLHPPPPAAADPSAAEKKVLTHVYLDSLMIPLNHFPDTVPEKLPLELSPFRYIWTKSVCLTKWWPEMISMMTCAWLYMCMLISTNICRVYLDTTCCMVGFLWFDIRAVVCWLK